MRAPRQLLSALRARVAPRVAPLLRRPVELDVPVVPAPAPDAPATKPGSQKQARLVAGLNRAATNLVGPDNRPVVIGPFTGEVGFELLYWAPLVRWVFETTPELAGRRVIYISRGGVEHWLHGLDLEYVDILSLYTPEELLTNKLADKQREWTAFEEDVRDRVSAKLGLEDPRVLHPEALYNFYYASLRLNQSTFARAVEQTDAGARGACALYPRMPRPELGPLADVLPDEFVAVRFYFRPSFPDTPENRAFAQTTIDALSRSGNVVLLNSGVEVDDHRDLDTDWPENVIRLDGHMQPHDNLHVQTVTLGAARAYVGTYGGLSYLAPFLGVPSLAFSERPLDTHRWHEELAQRIFDGPGWGRLVHLRPGDLELIDLIRPEPSRNPW